MAQRQTYESHIIGVGQPMTGEKLTGTGTFVDSVRFLPFSQGLGHSYQKNIVRESLLGKNSLKFNKQINWSDVSVNITQFDYCMRDNGYNYLFEDIHLVPRGTDINGSDTPILGNLISGGRAADGYSIYFLTDTGSRYRDQISNTGDYTRQYAVFDPCYLSSISWSQRVGSLATYQFDFVGNYIAQAETTTGDLLWQMRKPLKSGTAYTGQADMTGAHSSGSYINIQSASGLFQPNYSTLSGVPDLGEVRGVSWSIPIERTNVYDLGNPMALDRKITPHSVGSLTIDYNYEGQEIDGESFTDTVYDVDITNVNLDGDEVIYKIRNAVVESAGLNSSVGGESDTYSLQMSFPVSIDDGFFFSCK